jgi:hypothetical protein
MDGVQPDRVSVEVELVYEAMRFGLWVVVAEHSETGGDPNGLMFVTFVIALNRSAKEVLLPGELLPPRRGCACDAQV